MRIDPQPDGVSIWSDEIFGSPEASRLQDFLSRAFAVGEVESVELRRATNFGRIHFGKVVNARQILRKLGRAFAGATDAPVVSAGEGGPVRRIDAGLLYLDGPSTKALRVTRIGKSLSTWRVRQQSRNTLHLWHPALRRRRDVVFRLEEELGAILGVEDFRVSALTADVRIRFDSTALSVEHLARELEKAWPRLLDGIEGPPSRKRFIAAGALLVLAFTGQYLVPALRRVAVAGVVLYSLPNIVNGVKQVQRGEVGVYALYSAGVVFLLVSGMPFASTAITVLMQLWPRLARRKFVTTQRRLFAPQRRRQIWARIPSGEGIEIEVSVDDLGKDALVIVRSGETVPIDGYVQQGSAVVVGAPRAGFESVEQRAPGDWIAAGTFVRDGDLTIRVELTGTQTSASYLASLLPHSPLHAMPSLLEVERVANRNAKPALALSALSLALTRTARASQAVIRPDYLTAPRLSAQLSALHAFGRAAQEGIFFRNPAALDRLAAAEVYIIDDTAGLEHRRVEVANVQAVAGVAESLVGDYVLAARRDVDREQSRALAVFTSTLTAGSPQVDSLRHHAGVTRYRNSAGQAIEVATSRHVAGLNIEVPEPFRPALTQQAKDARGASRVERRDETSSRQLLWVLRDGQIIGVVSFARSGEVVGKRVMAALRSDNKRARLIYLSRGKEAAARALVQELGFDHAYGALDHAGKAELIRGFGPSTVWVGDGTDPDHRGSLQASTVSVSVAPLRRSPQDLADVLLPYLGLDSLSALMGIGQAHAARMARDYRTVYAANLAGVGGAFLARFNALRAGLLSNLGTAVVYVRQARALDRLGATAVGEVGHPERGTLAG